MPDKRGGVAREEVSEMKTHTVAENNRWWESLMNLLQRCPGFDGTDYDGKLSKEEREIIAELKECNAEYRVLKNEP